MLIAGEKKDLHLARKQHAYALTVSGLSIPDAMDYKFLDLSWVDASLGQEGLDDAPLPCCRRFL